jgi:hypothetical protein
MGLLDDAIREHLDLKRRRGADPLEVERDEREALGPVRRAPEALPGDEPDEEQDSLAYDQDSDEQSWSHDSPEPESADDERHPLDFESDLDDDEFSVREPEYDPDARSARADSEEDDAPPRHRSSGDETIEYDVEDALGSAHDKGDDEPPRGSDDDVLEETPEFLQDTPDHDRLWFEQRPPKDFDFDR